MQSNVQVLVQPVQVHRFTEGQTFIDTLKQKELKVKTAGVADLFEVA